MRTRHIPKGKRTPTGSPPGIENTHVHHTLLRSNECRFTRTKALRVYDSVIKYIINVMRDPKIDTYIPSYSSNQPKIRISYKYT